MTLSARMWCPGGSRRAAREEAAVPAAAVAAIMSAAAVRAMAEEAIDINVNQAAYCPMPSRKKEHSHDGMSALFFIL